MLEKTTTTKKTTKNKNTNKPARNNKTLCKKGMQALLT